MTEAFELIRDSAHLLLATAQTQLTHLPAQTVQSRWVWQIGVLHKALDHLNALHEAWLETRDNLPASPGTAAFDDALAVHHAECWAPLDDWATHGHAIGDIHTAARHAPSPLAPTPTTTAARTPAPGSPARR